MDGRRFDEITRVLVAPRSRRSLLRGLVAAMGAAVANRGSAEGAPKAPKCYGTGSRCTNGKQCCSGVCTNRQCAADAPPTCGNTGCQGACTSAGFTASQCNPICGDSQFIGGCPIGQSDGNPCCNAGYCNLNYFVSVDGVVTYVGPTSGC
jgi:hypothetical protein